MRAERDNKARRRQSASIFSLAALIQRSCARCAPAWTSRWISGKILRGTIKTIADGDALTMPATIDDPAILDEIGAALKGHGVGG